MKYLILIVFLFSMSCSDSNDTPAYLKEEKIIPSEISIDKTKDDNKLILEIQIALKERGYDLGITGILDLETKAAIAKFQKDNEIPHQYPVGSMETLRVLGLAKHELYYKIQEALKERGYKIEVTGFFDKQTKAVLTQFQKDNGLPIPQDGSPHLVIKALGIKY